MTTVAKNLKSKIISSSVITVLGFGSTQALRFVANLILARILFPEAFGIMALVNVVLVGLAMFSDVGIVPSIIQNKRGEEPAFLNTAWSIQIIRGFALWLIAGLIAWPAMILYGQDILLPLICVAGFTTVLDGFQSTAVATAPRNLQLGRLTIVQVSGQLIGITTMIVLAWLYQSVWALVIGSLVGAFAEMVFGHLFLPSHKHRLHFEPDALKALFNFGQWIFLSTLVSFLGGQGLRAIQGIYVSTATLGLISIAAALATIFLELTLRLSSAVIFPALSHIARERKSEIGRAVKRIRWRLLAATLPGFIMLSLSSGLIITMLYDERYTSAATFLAILAIAGAIETLAIVFHGAYMALGNTHIYFQLTAFSTFARIVGMVAGFHMGGVNGMLIGMACGTLCAYLMALAYAARSGWIDPLHELAIIGFITAGSWLSWSWHSV
ncbi:MAG: oligosaccharide flippase family protein [Hyphomicrobiaceae bacterium]|nr:oligosaccharide flippase family protein [Hyphomicrobiaceae bacterium]